MGVLLTSAYCAPVEYYAAIASQARLTPQGCQPCDVFLEAHENYQKQSWRNRCRIYSSQGALDLGYPIVHVNGSHNGILITDVRVDWSTPWVERHITAIDSAYKNSAFYDYYRDEFVAVMKSKPDTLWDFNLSLMRFFLDKLGIPANIRPTSDYGLCPGEESAWDCRSTIHPKKPNDIISSLGLPKEYFQVFSPQRGFLEGLSIMDLLFNEGPGAISFLK